MSLPVFQYQPKIQVVFFSGHYGEMSVTADIDPDSTLHTIEQHADLLACFVENGVTTPAGKWEVHLTGRRINGKTYAQRIVPMDYVEIKMSSRPGVDATGAPVLSMRTVMRGFVDNVQTTIDAKGNWRVVVNGRDYGKLLLQIQVWYRAELDPTADLIGLFRLENNFGFPPGVLTPQEFMISGIFDQIIAPEIQRLQQFNYRLPGADQVDYLGQPGLGGLVCSEDTITVPEGFGVNDFVIQNFTGPVWNLINQYASKPWIETFIVDQDDGAKLFYRFPPYVDYDTGDLIEDGSKSKPAGSRPHTSHIDGTDIETLSMGLSDNEVYNYFFTYPTFTLNLSRVDWKSIASVPGKNPIYLVDSIHEHGFRPLEIASTLIATIANNGGTPPPQLAHPNVVDPNLIDQAIQLNGWLYNANKDNHRFQNGSVTCRGNGDIQVGASLKIDDLGLQAYVSNVRHEFSVEQGNYRTTIGLTRIMPIR